MLPIAHTFTLFYEVLNEFQGQFATVKSYVDLETLAIVETHCKKDTHIQFIK
jgi:hypothetical protein